MSGRLSVWAQGVAVVAHLVLMALLALRGTTLAYAAVLLLLVPLPGLLRGKRYTYQWASMLLVIYSALWLSQVWMTTEGRAAAQVLALVSALEFVSLVLFVRWRDRERLAQTAG